MKSLRFVAVIFLASSFALAAPLDEKKEPFWKKVLRIVGISATPSAQKVPDEVFVGNVWLVNLEQDSRSRVTSAGDYRSPIFLPVNQLILALENDEVVQIGSGGTQKRIATIKGAVKLVGISADDSDMVLVLSEDADQRPSVGTLSLKTGQLTALGYDDKSRDDRLMLAHIRGWERAYGDTKVYVKTETKTDLSGSVEWTDVYLKQPGSEPKNVSKCDGVNCGQPSLSQNKNLVVYVKAKT